MKQTTPSSKTTKDHSLRNAGYEFTKGALDAICRFFAILLCISGVIFLLFNNTDSTDSSRWQRSGMRLHYDAATGIEYLSVPNGGFTPRLDRDGKPMIRPKPTR